MSSQSENQPKRRQRLEVAADAQTAQAGDRVARRVAQHRVAGEGQGFARAHHHVLGAHRAAGQRGVFSQAQRAAVGLSACAGDRARSQGGRPADGQAAQVGHRVCSAVTQYCVAGDGQ